MPTDPRITPIVMPKWGLSMKEGVVVSWLVEEGTAITVGMPILEVETDKIANQVEAPDPGLLRRRLAQAGQTLPVKALLGVMAPPEVTGAELDAYVGAYVVPAAGEDEAEAAPAYLHAEVDGIRVRYARRGDFAPGAVPLLFLHGFGGDLDNWLFNLDAAAAHSPVLALDLPGHGGSDARLPGTTLPALADFVVHFLDGQQVERAHAVGHSMGGAIAARMAIDHPGRVASLALVSSAGLGEEIDAVYLEGFVAAQSRRELKPVLERLFANPGAVGRQMVDDVLRYKRMDGIEPLLRELGAALFGGGRQHALLPEGGLEATGKPVLVVWGRQDRIIPVAHAGNAPAGATVEVYDDAGHMSMLERANDFNALLLRHVGA